jgi:hypothetical protein
MIRMPVRLMRACLFAFALGAAGTGLAVPLVDMRAEDLLPMASEFKKALNLNANQQTLWLQVEGRSRTVLRALWLGLNDALDDGQRRQVATLVSEQLQRVVPEGRPGGERGGEKGGERGERGGRGMGGHGRGINIGG